MAKCADYMHRRGMHGMRHIHGRRAVHRRSVRGLCAADRPRKPRSGRCDPQPEKTVQARIRRAIVQRRANVLHCGGQDDEWAGTRRGCQDESRLVRRRDSSCRLLKRVTDPERWDRRPSAPQASQDAADPAPAVAGWWSAEASYRPVACRRDRRVPDRLCGCSSRRPVA